MHCALCHSPGLQLCSGCIAALEPAHRDDAIDGLDALICLFALRGAGRDLLHRWKFSGCATVTSLLATALAEAARTVCVAEAVTWAPTSASRRRARGVDQAQTLAAAVAEHLGVPLRSLLAREVGQPQTGATREQRLLGPRFAAVAACPPHVLLVDDVVTTGATMLAAATTLRAAGATSIMGLAMARTPLPCADAHAGPGSRVPVASSTLRPGGSAGPQGA